MDESWISLQAEEKPLKGKINYRQVFTRKGWEIIYFKDHNEDYGMRIFFEKLTIKNLQDKKFPQWNEIIIKPFESNKKLFLDLRINNSIYIDPFITFSENVVSGADSCQNESELLESIFLKCNQWKLFMRNKRVNKLKRFEQQGLIGELSFLKILIENIGIKNAIDAWKGPDKLAKDFLLSSTGIEVKAKQGGLKGLVEISSEFQLDSEDLLKLYLVVFTIDVSSDLQTNSFTLTEQINKLKDLIIKKDSNLLDDFLGKVYMAGYDEEHDYKNDFWLVSNNYEIYIIDDNCPRIIPKIIKNQFISNVKYQLKLDGIKANFIENVNEIIKDL